MLYGDPLKSFVNLASFCQIPAFIGLYSYSLRPGACRVNTRDLRGLADPSGKVTRLNRMIMACVIFFTGSTLCTAREGQLPCAGRLHQSLPVHGPSSRQIFLRV
jgi:hypothetical protein